MFSIKKLVAVFVVFCFLRYIESARIPREDAASVKEPERPTSDFAVGVETLLDGFTKLKKAVIDDSLKNVFIEFRQSLEEQEKAKAGAKA